MPAAESIPAWPFLIANHEPQRVDYRPVVAPDFLCEEQRSAILTLLPFPEESTSTLFSCMVPYRVGTQLRQLQVVFQSWDRTDPALSSRQIRVLQGIVVLPLRTGQGIAAPDLERALAHYRPSYEAFCASDDAHGFPVIASWPLAIVPTGETELVYLAPCDATQIQTQHHAVRAAPPGVATPFPITRREIQKRLQTESTLTRLLRQFRVK